MWDWISWKGIKTAAMGYFGYLVIIYFIFSFGVPFQILGVQLPESSIGVSIPDLLRV
jgi:hypothetical protein